MPTSHQPFISRMLRKHKKYKLHFFNVFVATPEQERSVATSTALERSEAERPDGSCLRDYFSKSLNSLNSELFFLLLQYMTTLLGIRITANNDNLLKLFTEQYKGLWCKEGGDLEKHCAKTHYHGLVETKLTPNGLRKQIYNIFETPKEKRGQGFCAFSKITDAEGFERYLCKGTEKTYPEIIQNNFDIDTNERYDQYWDIYHGLQEQAKEKREKNKLIKQTLRIILSAILFLRIVIDPTALVSADSLKPK